MKKNLEAIYIEWEFIRSCSKSFINELSDAELDRELPRKGLNTFRKHFQEMAGVQKDFIAGIHNSVMKFNGISDSEIDGKHTKEQLLSEMKFADEELAAALEASNESDQVKWFGDKHFLLPFHLSAMISHEAMHIGQIIAFCYALDIEIPDYVKENWALSGK